MAFTKTSLISRQLLRNLVVAGASFVVDYGVFFVLRTHIDSTLALIIGYCSGIVINYILSIKWVFDERKFNSAGSEFGAFTAAALSGLAVEIVTFRLLNHVFISAIARLGSIGVAFVWNFALKELVIFRQKRSVSLRSVLGQYHGLSIPEYTYVALRYLTCPLDKVVSELPSSGKALEIGCGSGINLAVARIMHPNLELSATEIDPRKVSLAKKLKFRWNLIDDSGITSKKWDAVLIVDVLYLLGASNAESLIDRCIDTLSTGGKLVIKEMSRDPMWKWQWNRLQETISVKLTKMTTTTHGIQIVSTEHLANYARDHGHKTETVCLDHKYLWPHTMIAISK
jgi:putative flippase GtrA/SAM-dependent methyltransferase